MQSTPFKFRHVNRIAAAFIFLTVMMLAVLISLAATTQQWFAQVTEYRVEIPSKAGEAGGGTMGIKAGSDVRVMGNQVGHVKRVQICRLEEGNLIPVRTFQDIKPAELHIVAVLTVKGHFGHFVGTDSKAVLKYDLGGLGAPYFDISRGTKGFDDIQEDKFRLLDFEKEPDAKGEVFEIVKRIENEIVPAIKSYKATAEAATVTANETTKLIEDLANKDSSLQQSLTKLEVGINSFNDFVEKANSENSALGDMVTANSQLRKDFSEFASTLKTGTTDLKGAIGNLDEGITELRDEGIKSINETAKQLPGTVNKTNKTIDEIYAAAGALQETLREIEILTEGLQKTWLVKRHIEDPIEDPPEPEKSTGSSGGRKTATGGLFKKRK